MTQTNSTFEGNKNISEVIAEKDILWIIHDNGAISKEDISKAPCFRSKLKENSAETSFPEAPTKRANETLSNFYERFSLDEESRCLAMLRKKKERQQKLEEIKCTYRKQCIKKLLQRVFYKNKQR